MPDNNYVWIVMEDGVSFPIAVFQKRYMLQAWMESPDNDDKFHLYTILRFPPHGYDEWKEIDVVTLRAKK